MTFLARILAAALSTWSTLRLWAACDRSVGGKGDGRAIYRGTVVEDDPR